MKTARVADIAEQIRGVTFSKGDSVDEPRSGYLPVLTASNITEHGLKLDSVLYIPEEKISSRQRLQKNDVLITASSGSLSIVGRAVLVRDSLDAGFGAFCKVLRPGPEVDPNYFAHFFRTPNYRAEVSRLAAGANINNLRNEDLDGFRIPLPPLPEQRRIADILDRTDDLRAQRRRALMFLGELAESALTRISATSSKVVALGDVSTIDAKLVDPREDSYASYPLVAPDNIESNTGRIQNVRTTAEVAPISGKYLFTDSDVLYSKIRPALNKVALPDFAGLCSADMYPISVNAGEINREFLWATLRSAAFLAYAQRLGNRAQMPKLNRVQLFGYEFKLPSLESQRAYASELQLVQNLERRGRAHLGKLDELFASLQHRAFQGEL